MAPNPPMAHSRLPVNIYLWLEQSESDQFLIVRFLLHRRCIWTFWHRAQPLQWSLEYFQHECFLLANSGNFPFWQDSTHSSHDGWMVRLNTMQKTIHSFKSDLFSPLYKNSSKIHLCSRYYHPLKIRLPPFSFFRWKLLIKLPRNVRSKCRQKVLLKGKQHTKI